MHDVTDNRYSIHLARLPERNIHLYRYGLLYSAEHTRYT